MIIKHIFSKFKDKLPFFRIQGVFLDQGHFPGLFKVCLNPVNETLNFQTYCMQKLWHYLPKTVRSFCSTNTPINFSALSITAINVVSNVKFNAFTTKKQTTKFSSANFQKMWSPSYITLRIQRLEGNQCRSRWGGSLWATSLRSMLFANSAIFISGKSLSNNFIKLTMLWKTGPRVKVNP